MGSFILVILFEEFVSDFREIISKIDFTLWVRLFAFWSNLLGWIININKFDERFLLFFVGNSTWSWRIRSVVLIFVSTSSLRWVWMDDVIGVIFSEERVCSGLKRWRMEMIEHAKFNNAENVMQIWNKCGISYVCMKLGIWVIIKFKLDLLLKRWTSYRNIFYLFFH